MSTPPLSPRQRRRILRAIAQRLAPTAAALDRRQPTHNDYPDDELAEQDRTPSNTTERNRTLPTPPTR